MYAQPRGESVITFARVTGGFTHPETFARYEIEINAAGERFEREATAATYAPRNVVLAQSERRVESVGIGARQKSDHHIGLPAAFAPVIPPRAKRYDTHAARILQLHVSGNQTLQPHVTLMHAHIEAARCPFRRGIARRGAQCGEAHGSRRRDPKNIPLRNHSPLRRR